MFARIFKPKWQHRNPAKRIQAIDTLAANDPALVTLARQDQIPRVRAAAVAKLSDTDILQEIVISEKDSEVSSLAHSRLCELLCGKSLDSPALKDRLQTVGKLRSNDLIEYVARHANEADLRQSAVTLTKDPKKLSEIALSDPAIDVRVTALGLIDNISALEQVAKTTKKSDKRINQLARQRLKILRDRSDRKQRAVVLCDELEALCQQGNYSLRQSVLLRAKRQWPELSDIVDDTHRQRVESALARLHEICDNYRTSKNVKQNACQMLENISQEMEQTQEYCGDLEQRSQSALTESKKCWSNAAELEPAEEQSLSRRYRQATEKVLTHQTRLHQNTRTSQEIREFLDTVEVDAERGRYSTKKSIFKLRSRWDALAKPRSETLSKTLSLRFNQLYGQIERKRTHAAEMAKQLEHTLNEMIEHLSEAAENGQLNEAISLRDQIRYRLDSAVGLSAGKHSALEQSFKSNFPRIRELQSWRNWGASGVRERLCEQAEGLIGIDQTPHELAEQIRELRNSWKRLDRQSGPAADALWNRFNSACNQAYEPCRSAFEEEAKQRDKNLLRKQQIYEELKRLYEETDWEQVNWKTLVKSYNNLRQSWRQIGPVSRTKGRDIMKRYKKISMLIEKRLDTQRQVGLQLRKQLIEQVQQLDSEDDLNKAIEQAKRAQGEWNKVVVRASRKIEQRLWNTFRSACDQVFERRNALHQERHQAMEETLKKKTELCERLETLTQTLSQGNQDDSDAEVERLRQEWINIREQPREKVSTLEQRFQDALVTYHHNAENIKRDQAQHLWKALQQREQLCTQLETHLERPNATGEIDTIKSKWQKLAPLDEQLTNELQLRFQAALSALEGSDAVRQEAIQKLQSNAEQKRLQCLEMEILAGVKSPPEHAEQRMELNVGRLSERFEGQKTPQNPAKSYEIALQAQRQWLTSGMLPAEEMQALEHRFSIAGEAMLRGDH
jgi:hypothetical protein